MIPQQLKKRLTNPLLFPSLVFVLVNTTTSYSFYHVNSYKLVLMVLGLTFLAQRNFTLQPTGTDSRIPWRIWLFIATPLLATLPGFLWHQGGFNYNFRYELVTNLSLFLWVDYLYRSVKRETDFKLFFLFVGLVIIYNGGWSILEKTGFHPSAWQDPVKMVKATFGHRNYFSGFLIILLPMIAVFAVPDRFFTPGEGESASRTPVGINRFYMITLLAGCLGLALAQTRAAIAAFGIAMILVSYLFIHYFFPRHWRKRTLILYGVILAAGIVLALLMISIPDLFSGSRFAQLFTVRAWLGRRLAWETALASIQVSPLVGFGLGSSYNLFFSFVDPDARLFHHEHSYNHAHSEILEYTQEGGLIGLVVLILFWVWLIRCLVRLFKHPDISQNSLKLLIGIAGGFLAYHIHGSFSVAPRMIVTKLPLYTLIAILLILERLYDSKTTGNNVPDSIRNRIISGLPTLLILSLVWILYLPWAGTQWRFNKIRQEKPSFLQIRKLEALTRLSPDIYALDFLSHSQIEYKQVNGLKHTLNTIDRIIPHYRNLGYKKTLHALFSGNFEEAKQQGKTFQQRDRYHQPTIDLLMALAAKTGDRELFKEQFALSLRKQIFSHRLIDSLRADDVQIHFIPGEIPLQIETDTDSLTTFWGEKLVNLLFETARKNHQGKPFSNLDKARYKAYMKKLIASQSWFQLRILPAWEKDRKSLLENARNHHSLTQEWKQHKTRLELEHRRELIRTPSPLRKKTHRRQLETLARIQTSYGERINNHLKPLRKKTDWDVYSQKQQFIDAFTNRLARIIFPGDR